MYLIEKKLENVLQEAILRKTPSLERFLSTLGMLAAIATLLGLLGTVAEMINTFRTITLVGTGDPKMMSGGISETVDDNHVDRQWHREQKTGVPQAAESFCPSYRPVVSRECSVRNELAEGLRFFPVDRHIGYYLEKKNGIEGARTLHHAMDQEKRYDYVILLASS